MEFSPVLHAFARRVALVLLVAFGAASAAHGQGAGLPSRQNRLQRLTMDDGLPQSTVLALTQDRDGFMWLGTEDGLARYDGYALTPYRADPLDSTALPSGRITRLAGSYDGALWVGTNGGLVRLDPATGLVRRFQHRPGDSTTLAQSPVLSLLEDRGGTVFVGFAEGLSRLDPLTGRATNYPADFRDTATLTCPISLYQSVDGGLWAGTWNGVARVDRRTGALQRYLQRSGGYDCDRSVGAAAIALVEDPAARGVLWIATDSGLVRLDTRTGASRRWLPAPGRATGSPEGGANELRDLAWDPAEAGVLWVGTSGGLFRFVVATGQFTRMPLSNGQTGEASPDEVLTVFARPRGLVWVGTYQGGAVRFDPHEGGFRTLRVAAEGVSPSAYALMADRDGGLWAFGEDYLARFDRRTGASIRFPVDQPFDDLRAIPLYLDRDGVLWRASPLGVARYDRAQRVFRPVLNPDGASYVFNGFGETPDGSLWLAGGTGLSRFDRRTGRFAGSYPMPASNGLLTGQIAAVWMRHPARFWIALTDGRVFTFDPRNGQYVLFGQASREETGSGRGRPLRFYEDTQGRLWLRLLGAGLVQIDLRQRRFLRFAYRPGVLAEGGAVMHERRREPGVLWIGTWSGLHRLDVRTGQVRRYTVRDGLPSDYIYGLLEDVRGRLWISTTNGLSRFDPFAQSFKNFGPEHGLPAREFNEGAFAVAPDGQLFFGSIAGVSAFDPAELRDNQIPPVVHITGVRLFNRPLTPGPDSPLHQPSGEARRLVLDHDEDVVTFEFVGLEYEAPERVRYRYMLEGFDPSWVGAGTRREATYTNLKPGRYTFRVQAANADGVWSQVGAELTVVVHPPWWRTWWAYLCYVVLVVAGVRAAMRAQRQRIMARERERTERLRVEATEARLDAVGRELAVARRIQQGALPKALPESQGLEYVEVAARMVPAQEVGGDLYDFFWIDEHRLAFAIGDVAGKGVPAALFMAVTRSALRAVALTGLTPGPCMTRVNALLCEEALRGMFVTLFYGVLDVTTGHLAFANAGHNVPLFVPAAGEVTPLPRKPSLALCLRGNATYTELEMQLTPGDSLFLFTDGVTEAANVVRARFGDARLLSTVRSLVGRPPEQQINRVVTAVEMFAGGAPQADDITALAIRLKAKVTVPVAAEPATAEA